MKTNLYFVNFTRNNKTYCSTKLFNSLNNLIDFFNNNFDFIEDTFTLRIFEDTGFGSTEIGYLQLTFSGFVACRRNKKGEEEIIYE